LRVDIKLIPRFILGMASIVFMTITLGPTMLIRSFFPGSAYPNFRMGQLWNWVVAKCMGVTFAIKGAEKLVPGTSYIITPNHQSFADIMALFVSVPVPFRWVMKREILKIPIFGRAMAATGAICLDRSNRESAVQSLREGVKKLAGGWSVLIYPEGTRTPDGLLHSFKKGAFMMAVQSGISILPITCNGAFKIMPKKKLMFRPGHVTLTIGDPIPTEGLTENDVPQLMERTWQAINHYLNPDYDPFARPVPTGSPSNG
jgi:1-acyl-sn-glycerol-3-phosphate acyltransferase